MTLTQFIRFTLLAFISLIGEAEVTAQVFENVASIQGLNALNQSTDNWGSGISFYDFNEDGWDDLSIVLENDTQAIYMNNLGVLELVPFKIYNSGQSKSLLWVDYDNDGELDIFITTKHGQNHLFRNTGNFSFTETTQIAGISANSAANYGASFGDYDKDGFLDLYVCRYHSAGSDSTDLDLVNNLYHNNGDGTFTDVTFSAGVSDNLKQSFMGVWFDYNYDSWPDLYVINDRSFQGALYENNGDGTFTDVAANANLFSQVSDYMTCSVADYNNDSDLDVFVSNISQGTIDLPILFDNQSNGTFIDTALAVGLKMYNTTWGATWFDYDNDALQDLYVASAFLDSSLSRSENYFFKNEMPLEFVRMSTLFNGNHRASSHSVARGDLDKNGFYDIAVNNDAPDPAFLWQNSGNNNNYIHITLRGVVSNKQAIGSWIRVYSGPNVYTQYTMCGENYLGQNSQHHIFGVGQIQKVDSVLVEFPSGIINSYYNLQTNQDYLFVENVIVQPFQLNYGQDTVLCQGDSLVLTPPFFNSYLWSNGDTSRTLTVQDSGTYILRAIDSSGNDFESNSLYIDFVQRPIVGIDKMDPSCKGDQDAYVYLSITNSGQDYEVVWSNAVLGDTLEAVGAGVYTFQYTDTLACFIQDSVTINEPPSLNIQSVIVPESPDSLGSLQLLVNGGTPPYEISLNSIIIANQTDSLESGIYYLEVEDVSNCYYSDSIVVLYIDTQQLTSIRSNQPYSIQAFPNPFTNQLNLLHDWGNDDVVYYQVFNNLGQEITDRLQLKLNNGLSFIVFPDSTPPGSYIVSFQTPLKYFSVELVKK